MNWKNGRTCFTRTEGTEPRAKKRLGGKRSFLKLMKQSTKCIEKQEGYIESYYRRQIFICVQIKFIAILRMITDSS